MPPLLSCQTLGQLGQYDEFLSQSRVGLGGGGHLCSESIVKKSPESPENTTLVFWGDNCGLRHEESGKCHVRSIPVSRRATVASERY